MLPLDLSSYWLRRITDSHWWSMQHVEPFLLAELTCVLFPFPVETHGLLMTQIKSKNLISLHDDLCRGR